MRRDEVGEGLADGPAAIEWPQGGFQWTDKLRGELPPVRGIHPAAPLAAVSWSRPVALINDKDGRVAGALAEIGAAAKRHWTLWETGESSALLCRDRLAQPDTEFWLELCAQACSAAVARQADQPEYWWAYYRVHPGLEWVTRAGIELHGPAYMAALALQLAQFTFGGDTFKLIVASMLVPLRAAISVCDEAEHAAVMARLQSNGEATAVTRLTRAFLCPHRGDWAAACAAEAHEDRCYLLKHCVLPLEVARPYLKAMPPWMWSLRGSLLLQIQLHAHQAWVLLVDTLRRSPDRETTDEAMALVMCMQVPQQISLLVELIDQKEVRVALDKVAKRFPAAVLKTVVEHALATRSRLAEGWAVRLALREPAALASTLAALGAAEGERFQALLASLQTDEAAPEQLPPLLRQPPWLDKARAAELPVLDVPPLLPADRLCWTDDERARHAGLMIPPWLLAEYRGSPEKAEEFWLQRLDINDSGRERVTAGLPLRAEDIRPAGRRHYAKRPVSLLLLPDVTALAVWNSYPPQDWSTWYEPQSSLWAILARHGVAALPGLVRYVQCYADEGLLIALPVDSAALAPTALHALRNLKKAKAPAIEWLRAHAATALTTALPLAFGKDKSQRDNAQFGVRWLAQNGFEPAAREAAAAYGPAMSQALQALLDADPLLVLPSRMPKLPAFFVAPSFRRPQLRDGSGALPVAAVEHIGSMLAISKLEAPYAGLDIVRGACTPASLAEFAWDLFQAWMAAGSPSKEGWAFTALGLLGDDETARRLAPRIREWPGESAHQRAVAGLDLLAAIGTDVALMHLNGIAGKVKFKALQDRAKEKINAVAEARGLSAAELADRLVPDLGLDEQGTLALDFGPRQFFVAFDETLKPFVKDAQGVRLKDLPKPVKSDEAALAEAATERYKQMKKDAKAVASLQVVRLEQGMVERRRWPAADFRLFFLQHPLMRHLAARLVWGVYEQDKLANGFRVAEDWTLADAQDTLYELPDAATVGIAHVLEIPAPLQTAFGQVLADYEILQPFRQLGRETYALTPEEQKTSEIKRFADKHVASGSVMGLVNRGWERGQAQDAGWVGWFTRRVADGMEVQLELDPGLSIGDPSYEPKQRVQAIVLRKSGTWDQDGHVNFETLDPITASEVLRDVALLAPLKE
jgi:hypothetical protein